MEEAVYETLREKFDSAKMQEARENSAVEVLDLPAWRSANRFHRGC